MRRLFFVFYMAISFWAPSALSSEPYWEASNSFLTNSDDNYSLVSEHAIDVQRVENRFRWLIGEASKTSNVYLSMIHDLRNYYGNEESLSASINNFLFAHFDKQYSPRTDYSLDVKYSRDKTNTSEFDIGLTNIIRNDEKTRKEMDIKGAIAYSLNEVWRASVQMNKVGVDYLDAKNTTLISYNNLIISSSLTYDYSENSNIYFTLSTSKFEPKDVSSLVQLRSAVKTATRDVSIGWATNFTELDKVDVSLGYRHNQFTPIITGKRLSENGDLVSVSYSRNLEKGDLRLKVLRSLVPSSTGSLIENDRIDTQWTEKYSPVFSSRLSAAFNSQRQKGNTREIVDKYADLGGDLNFQLSRNQRLSVNYRHRRLLGESQGHSNAITLTWNWGSQKQYID